MDTLHVRTHVADTKTRLVFARDIQFDRQYLTLDQISMLNKDRPT